MMNTRTLLFFVLIGFCAKYSKAEQDSLTFTQKFDLEHLKINRKAMSTSILWDRIIDHNEQKSAEEIRCNSLSYFLQLYHQISLASYSKEAWENITHLKQRNKQDAYAMHQLNIGIIDIAVDKAQYQNGKLFEGKFKRDSVSAFSLLSKRVKVGNYQVGLQENNFFSNLQRKIQLIELEIDGQVYSIAQQTKKSISFVNEGLQFYSYKIYYDDESTENGEGSIQVNASTSASCIPIEKYSYPNNWLDYENKIIDGQIEVAYYFSDCTNPQIDKAIVIVDGFDPMDANRTAEDLYDLINVGPYHFADDLRSQGYDVITVNFPYDLQNGNDFGAGFIERNAASVQSFLQSHLKARMTHPNNPVILIGPSMGGLIARYALQEMERNNISHNVKLYISFDSPHLGANIPISIQHFLFHYGVIVGNYDALEGWEQVYSVAARQMLLDSKIPDYFGIKGNSYFDLFYQKLNMGFPTKSRNVSLINGSETMTLQGLPLKLMNYQLNTSIGRLTEADLYRSPLYGRATVFRSQYLGLMTNEDATANLVPSNEYIGTSLDNCPAGSTNAFQSIGQYWNGYQFVNKSGFSIHCGEHSFIPSISALAMSFNNGAKLKVNYDIQRNDIICNKFTKFDAYYAPTKNERHVALSKEGIAFVLQEIQNATKISDCPIVLNLGQVFNYGFITKQYIGNSVTVMPGATLGINMNTKTGLNAYTAPPNRSHFAVNTYRICKSPVKIVISSNAKLQLGDPSGLSATLRITKGEELTLESKSTLSLYGNTKLIIEEGAKLYIAENTKIILNDATSALVIEGGIEIAAGARLEFEGSGKLIIGSDDIVMGFGASIALESNTPNQTLLELNESIYFRIPQYSKLSVKGGKVNLKGKSSRIDVTGELELLNTTVQGGNGIVLHGQKNVSMSNVQFNNNETGLAVYQNSIERYGHNPDIFYAKDLHFINNRIGIRIIGQGFTLENIQAKNCVQFLQADGMSQGSSMNNCNMEQTTNSGIGIQYIGSKEASLRMFNCNLSGYEIGIKHQQSNLILKCCKIQAGNYAVYTANRAALWMSPNLIFDSGNNTLSVDGRLSSACIFLDQASSIHLSKGLNDFEVGKLSNCNFVVGTLKPIVTGIDFSGNSWNLTTGIAVQNPGNYCIIKENTSNGSPAIGSYTFTPLKASSEEINCSLASKIAAPCLGPGCATKSLDPFYYLANKTAMNVPGQPTGTFDEVLRNILQSYQADTSISNALRCFQQLIALDQQCNQNDLALWYLETVCENLIYDLYASIVASKQGSAAQIAISDILQWQIGKQSLNASNCDLQEIERHGIDYALGYNARADRATAINNLKVQAQQSLQALDYQTLQYWDCLLKAESDFIDGNIDVAQLESMLQSCNTNSVEEISFEKPLGIENNSKKKDFELSPNPASTILQVKGKASTSDRVTISIYNMQGKLLLQKHYSAVEFQEGISLGLGEIPAGLYLIRVDEGNSSQGKIFIKQ